MHDCARCMILLETACGGCRCLLTLYQKKKKKKQMTKFTKKTDDKIFVCKFSKMLESKLYHIETSKT